MNLKPEQQLGGIQQDTLYTVFLYNVDTGDKLIDVIGTNEEGTLMQAIDQVKAYLNMLFPIFAYIETEAR